MTAAVAAPTVEFECTIRLPPQASEDGLSAAPDGVQFFASNSLAVD